MLGFDDYADIAGRLTTVLAGRRGPRTRRGTGVRLLPISPAVRASWPAPHVPGHGRGDQRPAGWLAPASGPRVLRRRLGEGPVAPLKLASGCDRRCSFCAIPAFRGAFVSRPPDELLAEARWLADAGRPRAVAGQRELHLVRQGPRRPAAARAAAAAARGGRRASTRVRVSYLQPAEVRPGAGRGDRLDARRGALLRPVLPARERAGAALACGGSATPSGSSS